MSKIDQIILPQNYEYVRDRIAEILADELNGQLLLTGDYDLDVEVVAEDTTVIDESELPMVTVSLDAGSWGNKHQGSVIGTYVFNVDCITSSKSNQNRAGGTASVVKAQRLAGLCRSILEDPIYKTLGFVPPYISRTFCSDIKFGKPGATDANHTNISRITFNVLVNETSKLKIPLLIEGYQTTVKIDNTSKGYFYQGENY